MSTTGVMSVALLVLMFGVNLCSASRTLIHSAGTGHSLVGSRHPVVPAGSEGEEIHYPVFYTYNSRYDVESKDGYDGEKYFGYRSKLDGHGRPGEVKDCGHGKEDDGNHVNGKKKDEHGYYGYNGHGSKDDAKKEGHGSNVDDDGKKKGGCKDGHDSKDGGDARTRDEDSYGESKNYATDGDWRQAQAVPYKYRDYSRERP